MKKIAKSIIGLSLVSVMALATSCGSVKDDAIASLDTVIANGEAGKPFEFKSETTEAGISTEIVISRDANGNILEEVSANGVTVGVYYVDGETYYYQDGEDATFLLDDAGKQTLNSEMTSLVDEYFSILASNRASLDTAFLVDAVEDGDNFVINTTNEEGGTPAVVTVAKDGSKYTYLSPETGANETLTFSDEITVGLPQ